MEQHRGPEHVCDCSRSGMVNRKESVARVHSYLQGYVLSGINNPRHDILCTFCYHTMIRASVLVTY